MLRYHKSWLCWMLLACVSPAGQAVTVKDYPGALRQGYQYLFPPPDAEYVAPQTRIIIRFAGADPHTLTNLETFVQVTGARSGTHRGQTRIAADATSVLFTPNQPFTPQEQVAVSLAPRWNVSAEEVPESVDYAFFISGPKSGSQTTSQISSPVQGLGTVHPPDQGGMPSVQALAAQSVSQPIVPRPGQAYIMENGVSVPSNFPHILVTTFEDPDPGLIFIDNRMTGPDSYNVIFDNTGVPIWYWQTDDERRDMKVQRNGLLTMLARDGGMRFIGLDNHYRQVAEYRAVNGYDTDEHELVVLADGSYFLVGIRYQTVDMSRYLSGGNPAASVGESVIQGFTPAGEMVFQWRAWDHYDVRDVELDDPRSSSFRFPHMNAIDIDYDGHLLVSCRHLSEVTKINRQTGEIIWRLGGAHSDFTFVNDTLGRFRNQHAVRATDPNRYLLFDNGNLHNPPMSRGVEYELNTSPKVMTASVVWQYPKVPTTSLYSYYMGNTQRLPNGHTLINWAVGSLPKLTEVRPDGTKALELNWVNHYEAYRVWKCPWQGRALKPYLIVEPHEDRITLIYNQFGDPNVVRYRIYGGTAPQPKTVLRETELTLAELTDLQNLSRYYFRVTSVDANGVESDSSNEESVVVQFQDTSQPGVELVVNGDFSQGKQGWIWELQGGNAQWDVNNGVAHVAITDGGSQISSVQLRQAGLPLFKGRQYVFAFDAWAAGPRVIEAKVGQDQSPFTDYSQIGYSYVTGRKQHFQYTFTMNNPTDTNARVVINTGTSNLDVYLDNVSLKRQ